MPPKGTNETGGIMFVTDTGERISLEDIPVFEWTEQDEELSRHLSEDTFEMTLSISDECMDALQKMTAPAKHLVENIKNAFAIYFAEEEASR